MVDILPLAGEVNIRFSGQPKRHYCQRLATAVYLKAVLLERNATEGRQQHCKLITRFDKMIKLKIKDYFVRRLWRYF